MRAAALAMVTALTLPRAAHGQGVPCDPLAEFGCVYAPGPGNTELRTVVDASEWQPLPIEPWRTTSLVGLAPGSYTDRLGIGWSGGTSLETTWELDGLDVSDVVYGGNPRLEALPAVLLGRVIVRRAGLGAAMRGGGGGVVALEAPRGRGAPSAWGSGRSGGWDTAAMGLLSTDRSGIAWAQDARPSDLAVASQGTSLGGLLRWSIGAAPHIEQATYTRTFSRYRDVDQDGSEDEDDLGLLDLEAIERRHLPAQSTSLPLLGRIDLLPGGGHEIGLTTSLHRRAGRRYEMVDGEIDSLALEDTRLDAAAVGQWRWQARETTIEATAGYVAGNHDARSPDAARDRLPQRLLLLDESFLDYESDAVREGCSDGAGDPFPLIANCSLVNFGYLAGGPGAIREDTQSRLAGRVHAEQRLSLGGTHVMAAGADASRSRFEQHYELSGGYGLFFLEETRYVELGGGPGFDQTCAGRSCRFLDATAGRSAANSFGLFASDAYSPRPDLTIELGGRYDRQDLDRRYHLDDFVPRASIAWDPLGGGRSRLFAATGGYVALVPLNLATGAHAPTSYRRLVDPDTMEVTGEIVLEPGTGPAIASGTGPMRVNELVLGAEAALGEELRVGISFLRRDLGRILEDTATGDGFTLFNPAGRRDYDELAVEVRTNPDRPLSLRASYTFTRLRGDHEGFHSQDNGQVAPGTLTAFDDPEFMFNTDGRLPSERPHAFDLGAAYRTTFGHHAVTVGVRALAFSGTPWSALGRHYLRGYDEIHILPRGAMGRTPYSSYVGLRTTYALSTSHRVRYEFFADLMNAFDHQEPVGLDQRYTLDSVSPIVGGRYADLVFLKARGFSDGGETSDPIDRNQTFGQPTARYPPLSTWIGVRIVY